VAGASRARKFLYGLVSLNEGDSRGTRPGELAKGARGTGRARLAWSGRCAQLSKTAKAGAASVVVVSGRKARVGQPARVCGDA